VVPTAIILEYRPSYFAQVESSSLLSTISFHGLSHTNSLPGISLVKAHELGEGTPCSILRLRVSAHIFVAPVALGVKDTPALGLPADGATGPCSPQLQGIYSLCDTPRSVLPFPPNYHLWYVVGNSQGKISSRLQVSFITADMRAVSVRNDQALHQVRKHHQLPNTTTMSRLNAYAFFLLVPQYIMGSGLSSSSPSVCSRTTTPLRGTPFHSCLLLYLLCLTKVIPDVISGEGTGATCQISFHSSCHLRPSPLYAFGHPFCSHFFLLP
jgi:hypothetical protein